MIRLNRTQGLVLGFIVLVWASLVVIVATAPELSAQILGLPDSSRAGMPGFLIALSGFLVLLGIGVVRRWRWTFWLILIAFLAGILRVPAALVQILGVVASAEPTWYLVFQMIIGSVQFAIGLVMLAGYRRGGAWAAC